MHIYLGNHVHSYLFSQFSRKPLKKMYISAITGFQTFYWSIRTASPQFIQWIVRINRFWQLRSVHRIHINLEATSPLKWKAGDIFLWIGEGINVHKALTTLKPGFSCHFYNIFEFFNYLWMHIRMVWTHDFGSLGNHHRQPKIDNHVTII